MDYYGNLVKHYLTGKSLQDVGWTWKIQTEKDVLACVGKIASEILAADPVFRAPLAEEMVARMGGHPATVQEALRSELTEGLEDSVRLKTMSLERCQEIYILNKKDGDGSSAFYLTLLDANKEKTDVQFLDSGNNRLVEVIRLYRCDQRAFD